jgi:hypothetical protein
VTRPRKRARMKHSRQMNVFPLPSTAMPSNGPSEICRIVHNRPATMSTRQKCRVGKDAVGQSFRRNPSSRSSRRSAGCAAPLSLLTPRLEATYLSRRFHAAPVPTSSRENKPFIFWHTPLVDFCAADAAGMDSLFLLPAELWSQIFLRVAEVGEITFPDKAMLLHLMLVCRAWRVRLVAFELPSAGDADPINTRFAQNIAQPLLYQNVSLKEATALRVQKFQEAHSLTGMVTRRLRLPYTDLDVGNNDDAAETVATTYTLLATSRKAQKLFECFSCLFMLFKAQKVLRKV